MRYLHFLVVAASWMLISSICPGYSGGNGTAQSPYQISNPEDLIQLAQTTADYNKSFILTADINMQEHIFHKAVIAPDTNPVDDYFQGIPFGGTFDGNGYKIFSLTIETESEDYLGLFGLIEFGTVTNLKLVNFAINYSSESFFIGGLAGTIAAGSVSRCSADGIISGSNFADQVGGLVGDNHGSTINLCHSAVDINGFFNISNVGGLMGKNSYGGIVSNCYSTGSVTGDYAVGGLCGGNNGTIIDCRSAVTIWGMENALYIGGLCGLNSGTIESCFAEGNVNSEGWTSFMGGLCGGNSSTGSILNCYAIGAVTGGENSNNIGGLCGDNYNSIIRNCYSIGAVTAGVDAQNLGGLCGFQSTENDGYSEIKNSFWDMERSNINIGFNLDPVSGGTITNVPGLTTAQMKIQNTFTDSGWDFVGETTNGTQDIWKICDDGTDYPRLTWQSAAGDFACPNGVGSEDLGVLSACWLARVQSPADINQDDQVNLADFLWLAQNWPMSNCNLCNGADITGDGNVDIADILRIAEDWLALIHETCQIADVTADSEIDLEDLAIFAAHWLEGQPGGPETPLFSNPNFRLPNVNQHR